MAVLVPGASGIITTQETSVSIVPIFSTIAYSLIMVTVTP